MSSAIYMVAAKRSAVVPRGGAFAHLPPHELAAPVVKTLLTEAEIAPAQIDTCCWAMAYLAAAMWPAWWRWPQVCLRRCPP